MAKDDDFLDDQDYIPEEHEEYEDHGSSGHADSVSTSTSQSTSQPAKKPVKKSNLGLYLGAVFFLCFVSFFGYKILFKPKPHQEDYQPISQPISHPVESALPTPPGMPGVPSQPIQAQPIQAQPIQAQPTQTPQSSSPGAPQSLVQTSGLVSPLAAPAQIVQVPAQSVDQPMNQLAPALPPPAMPVSTSAIPSSPILTTPVQNIPTSPGPGQAISGLTPAESVVAPSQGSSGSGSANETTVLSEILQKLNSMDQKVGQLSKRVDMLEGRFLLSHRGEFTAASSHRTRKKSQIVQKKPKAYTNRSPVTKKPKPLHGNGLDDGSRPGSDTTPLPVKGQAMDLVGDLPESSSGAGQTNQTSYAQPPHSICSSEQGINIRAIIMGRIWVQFRDGSSANYTVGDRLPDGRHITKIDVSAGKVYADGGLWSC